MSFIKNATSIASYVLSSQLDSFSFTTDLSCINVNIRNKTKQVYSAELYAYNGSVTLYGLRQIIEDYIVEQNESFMSFILWADGINEQGDTEESNSVSFGVIYCKLCFLGTVNAETFAMKNILCSSRPMILRRGDSLAFSYWTKKSEGTVKRYISYVYSVNGLPAVSVLSEWGSSSVASTQVVTIELDYGDLLDDVAGKINASSTENIVIHSVTFIAGARYIPVFFVDVRNALNLEFRNMFNAMEHVAVECDIKECLQHEKEEAVVNGVLRSYNISEYTEFEVEAHCISRDHSKVVAEAVASSLVSIEIPYIGWKKILVRDITSELSTIPGKDVIKFKYRFEERGAVFNNGEANDFNQVFNNIFNYVYR